MPNGFGNCDGCAMEIEPNGAVDSIPKEHNMELFKLKIKNESIIEFESLDNIEYANKYIQLNGTDDLKQLQVFEVLGKGSESIVYKAKTQNGNKYFALKLVRKIKDKKINSDEFLISKKMKNKYVAKILYYYASPNQPYDFIVMECGKTDLSKFCKNVLKRNAVSETFLCYIAYQVLKGLHFLHKCKIAHFDIKPKNIVISDYLEAKLIDFSVSYDYSTIKNKYIKLNYRGTTCLMAPEILKSERIKVEDINKLDVYSLGVTLYLLAFGEYPHEVQIDDSDDVIYKKIKSEWKVTNCNNYFSKHFIDFLQGLLNGDINERMSVDDALNHYWIKGIEKIEEEKEKTYNANIFLSYLITDHIREFQEYIKQ